MYSFSQFVVSNVDWNTKYTIIIIDSIDRIIPFMVHSFACSDTDLRLGCKQANFRARVRTAHVQLRRAVIK